MSSLEESCMWTHRYSIQHGNIPPGGPFFARQSSHVPDFLTVSTVCMGLT